MSEFSMPIRAVVVLLAVCACLAGPPALQAADDPAVQPTEKWYGQTRNGTKTGYLRVVWAPSTWEGKKTLHDTTTVINQTQRDMAGMKDRFSTTVTMDLERSADGILWSQRVRTEEGGRVQIEEWTWTGKGYRISHRIKGQPEKAFDIALDDPVQVDAESVLGGKIRAGALKVGDTAPLRQLDFRARTARAVDLVVLAKETIADENGKDVLAFKVAQRDPKSRTEMFLWLDEAGTVVQLRNGAILIHRTTQQKAEDMPARPAEFSITVPASPRLERIFSADRVVCDVHVRPDEHRKLPEFPASPWTRVLEVGGDEKSGHVIRVELLRHDNKQVKALIPIAGAEFERHLEATPLMQTQHPLVQETVKEVIGEERNARDAAYLLSRFVFRHLRKQSLDVGQGDAVQILKDRQGDCSEHALLFVTLCRAAGIPARLCSGFVCIGGIWGAHSWAEIWTGGWIGADPTTGEVGTGARYIFYGYPDDPDSYPAVVSSRTSGRLRILTRRIEEGPAAFDLDDQDAHRIYDREGNRYIHVLAGLEARDVPEGWTVDLSHDRILQIRGAGITAQLRAQGDQGDDLDSVGRSGRGTRTTFAGAPALLRKSGTSRTYIVHSRRRLVVLYVGGADDEDIATLEKVLAATFAETPLAWPEGKKKDDGTDEDK